MNSKMAVRASAWVRNDTQRVPGSKSSHSNVAKNDSVIFSRLILRGQESSSTGGVLVFLSHLDLVSAVLHAARRPCSYFVAV